MRLERLGPPIFSLFALLFLGRAAGSCSLVIDTDNLSGASQAPATCDGKTLPAMPNGMDEGSIEFTSALRGLDLGENASDFAPIGLNLDGLCTCPDQSLQCKNPISPSFVACDGEKGIDNTSSDIVKALLTTDADYTGSVYYSAGADQGYFSLLFRIRGYNGTPSDPRVSLAIYESPGFMPQGMGIQTPAWTGQEAWTVSSASLKDGASLDQPVFQDENAYVADGTLVAAFASLSFALSGKNGYLRIGLQNVSVSAHIAPAMGNTGYRLEQGLIAGLFPQSEVFRALSTFKASNDVLCNDGGFFYNQTKKAICNSMDIYAQSPDPAGFCNASSFGMSFESDAIVLGAVTAPLPHATTCPAAQDPQNDQCVN